ncbi:MAG: putative phage head protein [Cetobacterium sp.]|uniref:putative phage head protein n=1 Tax=Cetobacterium sp. TaxID=2071632 RepID=UPI003EE44CD4
MCFSAPKISVPDTPTPAPLPPPIEDAPKVEGVEFGGSAETDTETASGIKGEKSKGKSSLKVKKEPMAPKKTGANIQMNK